MEPGFNTHGSFRTARHVEASSLPLDFTETIPDWDMVHVGFLMIVSLQGAILFSRYIGEQPS
jgi:hypothetical protein